MDPSTMYLTAFLIIGGIIFLVLFFHYVPVSYTHLTLPTNSLV